MAPVTIDQTGRVKRGAECWCDPGTLENSFYGHSGRRQLG